jgi:hypothetical protein
VFVGGRFDNIAGVTKRAFAALTKGATATANATFPEVQGGDVFALKHHDGAVYLGGFFSQVGDSTRWRLAKIDAATGAVSAWHPLANIATDPQRNSYRVQAIEAKGTSIFAAGQFRTLLFRPNSAEFHSVTGVENQIEVMAFGLVFANKLVNNHLIVAAPSFDFRVMRSFDSTPRSSCGSYEFEDGTEVFTSGVYPLPAVDFFYRDTFIDLNITINPIPSDSVTQINNALVAFESNASSYIWFSGCTLCGGRTEYANNAGRNGCAEYIGDFSTNTFTPDSSGEYLVIINKNGCDAFVCINFAQCAVDTAISLVGDSLVAGATNATAYEWFNCATNTAIAGATGKSYQPTTTGSYGVRVTQLACGEITTRCNNVVISSVSDIKVDDVRLSIYPNPASTMLNIESDEALQSLQVVDLTGRIIIAQNNLLAYTTQLSTDNLAQATYFIRITTTNGKTAIKSFVKQ